MRTKTWLAFLVAAAASLTGCGGGSVFGDAPATVQPTGVPASVTLFVSSPELSSDANIAANGVTVTALVRDGNNGVVGGASVEFAVNNNASVNPQLTESDGDGIATSVVTTGNDPTNRILTITVTARTSTGQGGATNTITVRVVGTTIAITGVNNAQFGAPNTYTVSLLDAAGQGISNRTVTLTSSSGNAIDTDSITAGNQNTLVTNGSGQGTFSYTPTTSATTDTITATALGISDTHPIAINTDTFAFIAPTANAQINLGTSQTVSVRWQTGGVNVPNGTIVNFAITRGTLSATSAATTNGVATVTVSSTSAGIATLLANSSAGTQPETTLHVEFVATTPAKISVQASPTVISTNSSSEITATVRDANDNLVKNVQVAFSLDDSTGGTIDSPLVTTNSQGVAKVIYNSTGTVSATDGVVITATVNGTAITDDAAITVGGRASRIVLGTGNQIFEPNETTYRFPYSVIVTDNNGAAAAGTEVFLKVQSLRFRKGFYAANPDGDLFPFVTATCDNEDINLNGVLDTAEDINGNLQLDPSNPASVPESVTVGEDGSFQFDVTYPQDRGNWVIVRLTASATVSGSEATQSADFLLPISANDADNPPGHPSPFGIEGDSDLPQNGTPEDDDADGRLGCADAD